MICVSTAHFYLCEDYKLLKTSEQWDFLDTSKSARTTGFYNI
jgi:hypothetical protein